MKDKHIILTIDSIKNEAHNIKTFFFRHKLNAEPGQFIIVWIPRLDEKPFGVSYIDQDRFGITVAAVGEFSKKMHSLNVGDSVGIRGAYGTSFSLKGKHIALVGGGYGSAPLALLAEQAADKNISVHFVIGAKQMTDIPFIERFKNMSKIELICTTEDKSSNFRGLATDSLLDVIKNNKIDMIYTCGPEQMMKKVVEISDKFNIDCECNLERYMKCGIGICGQCCVDTHGWRVCKEGPVFSKEKVKMIKEFGEYKRSASGKKIYFSKTEE